MELLPELPEDAIKHILQSRPDCGVKTILKEMHLGGFEICSKEVRSIVSRLKDNIQEERLKQLQICVKNESSEAVCRHLDDVLCALLKTPYRIVRNFQALVHVFNGMMGPYDLDHDCISQLITQHPLYRGGNAKNTPLYSCKLATTLVMLLCSELNVEKIKTIASFLARSSGAFDNMSKLPPNTGILMATVESVKNEMLRDRRGRVFAFSMTDLYAFQNPYQQVSIAHTFVLALSIDKDDHINAIQYQAFGPPDIGYDLTSWCLDKKSPRHLPMERLVEFIAMYEMFVKQAAWNRSNEQLYSLLFGCRLQMRAGYRISVHTRTLVAEPTMESIDTMRSLIQIG